MRTPWLILHLHTNYSENVRRVSLLVVSFLFFCVRSIQLETNWREEFNKMIIFNRRRNVKQRAKVMFLANRPQFADVINQNVHFQSIHSAVRACVCFFLFLLSLTVNIYPFWFSSSSWLLPRQCSTSILSDFVLLHCNIIIYGCWYFFASVSGTLSPFNFSMLFVSFKSTLYRAILYREITQGDLQIMKYAFTMKNMKNQLCWHWILVFWQWLNAI